MDAVRAQPANVVGVLGKHRRVDSGPQPRRELRRERADATACAHHQDVVLGTDRSLVQESFTGDQTG